jgi:hypothetical protein
MSILHLLPVPDCRPFFSDLAFPALHPVLQRGEQQQQFILPPPPPLQLALPAQLMEAHHSLPALHPLNPRGHQHVSPPPLLHGEQQHVFSLVISVWLTADPLFLLRY